MYQHNNEVTGSLETHSEGPAMAPPPDSSQMDRNPTCQGINQGTGVVSAQVGTIPEPVHAQSTLTSLRPDDDPSSPEGGVGVLQAPDDYYHEDAVAATSDEGQSPAPQAEDEAPTSSPSPPEDKAALVLEDHAGDEKGPLNGLPFLVLLYQHVSVFRTRVNRIPYASVLIGDRRINLLLKSSEFRHFVGKLYHECEGALLKSAMYRDLLEMLEAKALYESLEHDVHLRIAEYEGASYLNLANDKGEIVKITPDGYEIISSLVCPVKFVHSPRLKPMAVPEPGGSFEELWEILNIKDEHHRVLIVAWLLGCMLPNGPFPILIVIGEQGSGKTSLFRILRDMIDPSSPDLFGLPSSERDLAIAAINSWLLAFDNTSSIPDKLADALCRVSTGGGFATRALFTDAHQLVGDIQRPILINGITQATTRSDFNDRSICINMPVISTAERLPESFIRERWQEIRGRIMGALCNAVSCALRNRNDVKLLNYPRMADFARWVVAAAPALGWEDGSFMREYMQNRTNIIEDAIYCDSVAQAVRMLVNTTGEFTGTPSHLLAKLNELTPDAKRRDRSWPTMPNVLSNRLRRVATFLRERGIDIQFSKSGVRNIAIAMIPCNECACEVGALSSPPIPSCQGQSMVDFSDQSLRQVATIPQSNIDVAATTAIGGAA
jgi:hypothetical protein